MPASSRRDSVPLDDATIAAVEILNEAIKDTRVPGVNDFMMVTSALQRVVDDRSSGDLAVAGAAFDRLDGRVRAGIAEKALDRAEDRRVAAARTPQQSPSLPPSSSASSRPLLSSAPLALPALSPLAVKVAGKTADKAAAKTATTSVTPAAKGQPLINAAANPLRRKG